MERYCSTGQSPQRAVAPTEEEVYAQVSTSLTLLIHQKGQNLNPSSYQGRDALHNENTHNNFVCHAAFTVTKFQRVTPSVSDDGDGVCSYAKQHWVVHGGCIY